MAYCRVLQSLAGGLEPFFSIIFFRGVGLNHQPEVITTSHQSPLPPLPFPGPDEAHWGCAEAAQPGDSPAKPIWAKAKPDWTSGKPYRGRPNNGYKWLMILYNGYWWWSIIVNYGHFRNRFIGGTYHIWIYKTYVRAMWRDNRRYTSQIWLEKWYGTSILGSSNSRWAYDLEDSGSDRIPKWRGLICCFQWH